jgi:hypothetical protein
MSCVASVGVCAASLAAACVLDGMLQQRFMALQGSTWPCSSSSAQSLARPLLKVQKTTKKLQRKAAADFVATERDRYAACKQRQQHCEVSAEALDAAQAATVQRATLQARENDCSSKHLAPDCPGQAAAAVVCRFSRDTEQCCQMQHPKQP